MIFVSKNFTICEHFLWCHTLFSYLPFSTSTTVLITGQYALSSRLSCLFLWLTVSAAVPLLIWFWHFSDFGTKIVEPALAWSITPNPCYRRDLWRMVNVTLVSIAKSQASGQNFLLVKANIPSLVPPRSIMHALSMQMAVWPALAVLKWTLLDTNACSQDSKLTSTMSCDGSSPASITPVLTWYPPCKKMVSSVAHAANDDMWSRVPEHENGLKWIDSPFADNSKHSCRPYL